MDGLLVVDKPVGPTSHDVVARVRRALREKRIGHTGTLDPAASGVLPLVIGKATRLARFLSASDKQYEAVIRLGWSTDTGDAQGAPVGEINAAELPERETVNAALATFRGTFLQQPPAYSAKRIDGRRAYAIMRAASVPSLQPASVTVHAIDLVSADGDLVTVRISCSSGFYVRSLANDFGARLGTGAHVAALRRTASGPYQATDAIPLTLVESDPQAGQEAVIPMARLLPDLPSVVLTAHGATRAEHGRELGPSDLSAPVEAAERAAGSWIRLLDSSGHLVGIARVLGGSSLLHPSVVLR